MAKRSVQYRNSFTWRLGIEEQHKRSNDHKAGHVAIEPKVSSSSGEGNHQ